MSARPGQCIPAETAPACGDPRTPGNRSRITHTSALGRIDYTYLGRGAQIIREQHASGLVIDRYHESNPGDRRLMAIVPWSASHPPGSGARAHLYRTRPENRIDAHGTLPGRIAQYGYDAGDRLTRETEDPWTQYWRNWSRELPADAQSVLTPLLSQYGPQSTGGRQETQYTQDPSDNLTARKGPAGQWTGTVNAGNQYLHAAGSPWQHDLAGNLLDDGKRSYAWDAQHRLISITDKGSGKRSEFAYDGQSRLTVIREYSGPGASGVETRLLWCEDKVCQKRDGWDRPLARYFDEGEMQGNRALHYVRDHLGSIRDLVSATGSPLGRLDYGPYGEEKATQGEVTEHRYAGMLRHAETGFYITHYRIYDPWMGRWLSRDPIGEVGGINLYTYVGGNPVKYTDPMGLEVYLCSQPAFGWMPVDHQWIKTDSVEAGMGGTRGNVPGNQSGDRYNDPVQVTDHSGRSNEKGSSCQAVPNVDEKKVNEQLKVGRPLGNWTAGNQCQSFARQVLNNARNSPGASGSWGGGATGGF